MTSSTTATDFKPASAARASAPAAPKLKLNLGCGGNPMPGFVNVDSAAACKPDLLWDLEQTPWPWADGAADTIFMIHVLEHLGQSPKVYLNIIQELWRVSCDGAQIHLVVPHHRHDDFVSDPTHVRPITALGLALFDKRLCQEWQRAGYANTPLALYCNVDFEVQAQQYDLEPHWQNMVDSGQRSLEQVLEQAQYNNNIIKQMRILWRVHKNR